MGHETYYQYDTAGRTKVVIDPELNVTATVYDGLGNVVETSQWRPLKSDAAFPIDYPQTVPSSSDYEEVSSTRSAYNVDNLLIFTGTTTGKLGDPDWQWHNITVNYYDTQNQNHLKHVVKVNIDDVSDFTNFNLLVDDDSLNDEPALSYFSDITQLVTSTNL